jgi:Probable cobalt transporter subunit (CbtA)
MEGRIAARGLGAGALAGLFAFIFARILAEPQIQKAIDYESARDAAQDALRKAAGLAVAPADPDIFSRGVQRNVGVGVGMILFGVAMGGLLAVVYVLVARAARPRLRPRTLAALLAAAGFLGLYLLPFLKYPANPPAIGHENTIRPRSELYVTMVVCSVIGLAGAAVLWRRLTPRLGSWWSTAAALVALGAFLAVIMAILPPFGHLAYNKAHYGNQVTETPVPLRDAHGNLVFPGFPADVLFKFRLYSVLAQGILWATLAFVFGPLAERVLEPKPVAVPAAGSARAAT